MITMDGERHLSTFLGGDSDAMDGAVETVRRQNEAAQELGTFAIRGVLSKAEEQVQAAFNIFVNAPHVELPAKDQLAFMGDTLIDLGGYNVPDLSRRQAENMDTLSTAHHNRRVVPVPLLDDVGSRLAIVEAARVFPAQQFAPNESALRLPLEEENPIYRALLADLETVVKRDGIDQVILYKTLNNGLANRPNYKATLKEADRAIEEDGITWAFTFMDVRVKTPRIESTSEQLYSAVSPVAIPESLILTGVLHQAAGTPNPDYDIDFANEAVYSLDEAGNPSKLENVCTVRWRPDLHQIGIYARRYDSTRPNLGVRVAGSAI